MRILLKTIWSKFGQLSDKEIPKDDKVCFEYWAKKLQQLIDRKLDGCHIRGKPSSVDLHIFSDASSEAMSVVAYLRAEIGSGVEFSSVTEKRQIPPLKRDTVSKSELQAALYAV